jgi:hypothetical protein
MSSSDKCKHKTLSAKAEIIKLDKGEKLINFGCATIYDIRKNREEVECFVKDSKIGI